MLKMVAPMAFTMMMESAMPRLPLVARAAIPDATSWSGR